MRRSYHSNLAFLDLLFNALLCFAALFMIAIVLINPKNKIESIIVKAEFLITVSWPADVQYDVDTYVEDPLGNLIFFMRKEDGLMHLDRDDVGKENDTMLTENGEVSYDDNREIVTIRGSVPGEYVINIHLYRVIDDVPVPVTVQVDKINPFRTIFLDTITLEYVGEERTACRFLVDSNAKVISVNNLQKSLVVQDNF